MNNNHYGGRLQSRIDSSMIFFDSLKENPLTVSAAGATIIVGGCISMTGAVIISIMLLCILPVTGMISAVEMERMPARMRPAVYCAISAVMVLAFSLLFDRLFPDSVSELGIFIPLIAFDSLVLARTDDDAPYLSTREGAFEGLAWGLVFAVIGLPVALVREVIGGGQLFGSYLGFDGLSSLQKPFIGFILCGAALGVYRAVVHNRERRVMQK